MNEHRIAEVMCGYLGECKKAGMKQDERELIRRSFEEAVNRTLKGWHSMQVGSGMTQVQLIIEEFSTGYRYTYKFVGADWVKESDIQV